MDCRIFWLICVNIVFISTSNAKKSGQGEAWMIKSNLVGDEFNTLNVQRYDKPTKRNKITNAKEQLSTSYWPTREPGKTGKSAVDKTTIGEPVMKNPSINLPVQDSKAKKSENGVVKTSSNRNSFIIRVDDQDATDNVKEQKRNLNSKEKTTRVSKTGTNKNTKKLKVRQEIESSPEVYAGESVGKPYGDPDGYQTIGDGIFLMSTEQEAALTPKTTGSNTQNLDTFVVNSDDAKTLASQQKEEKTASKNMPEPSADNLPEILTHLDTKSAKKRHNGTQEIDVSLALEDDEKHEKSRGQDEAVENMKTRNHKNMTAVSEAGKSAKNDGSKTSSGAPQAVGSADVTASNNEPSADTDAMTPVEMKALQRFQDKLGLEDKVIGKLILTKKEDKGQLEYIKKTNDMLQKENQQQIDNVFDKYKKEESNFIKKNPFVVDKSKLLETIKNSTYVDVGATKRAFLGTNDNLRVENVYDSLLKEDEMISKGLNGKAELRKAIGRHKDNPEEEQVSKFLDFLEEEDKKTENGNEKDDVKPKVRSKKKKKISHSKANFRLMVIEPSIGKLSDKYSADGAPLISASELKQADEHDENEKESKKSRKVQGLLRKRLKTKMKSQEEKGSEKTRVGNGREENRKSRNGHGEMTKGTNYIDDKRKEKLEGSNAKFKGTRMERLTSAGVTNNENEIKGNYKDSVKNLRNEKAKDKEQKIRIESNVRKLKSKRKSKSHRRLGKLSRVKDLKNTAKMMDGSMTNDLYVTSKAEKNVKGRKFSSQTKDTEYYWHGTEKPETRELPTDPVEQIRKLGRISNIVPVSFEPAVSGGLGEIIGDSNNIANIGTATKETNGFGDTNAEINANKGYGSEVDGFGKQATPTLNMIDENAISSTSFFSASKPTQDAYNEIIKQGIDPVSKNLANSAMNDINENELEKAKGLVDKDASKVLSMFRLNALKPKLEELISGSHAEQNSYKDDEEDKMKHLGGNKKHKLKIVLHLPDQMEGNIQEIHGKDSETSIGTIKDMTLDYAKNERKPSLGQELANDDEDTLEGILSKPTAKLEEFHPQATVPSIEYVPETVQGRESNEWNVKEGNDKEGMNFVDEEKGKNDYMDNVKSNRLLSMIKQSEELLQKELGRHGTGEESTESFFSKEKDNDSELEDVHHHERGESKSVKSKSKERLKNKKRKDKNDYEQESSYYKAEPTMPPNIFADQMDYEHKSREVSQEMPTETVNKIDQIYRADEHLMPIKFLLEDQDALRKPGIGPLAAKNRKRPTKASRLKEPTFGVPASAMLSSKQRPTDKDLKLPHHNPLSHLVPAPHNLHIEGGNIHGGIINGGFISGGDIEGGDIEGGIITGGKILGGLFKNGRMEDGVLQNGTIEGGIIKGGNISGGRIRDGIMTGGKLKGGEIDGGRMLGGEIDGGFLKAGEIRGGTLKKGSVEGGLLKGGTIEGGHLLGGVMLGGKLKGGIVKSGVIKGGVIEGGVVDGGVIEDGVVIKGGVVRGSFPRNTTAIPDENFRNKTLEDNDELADKKIEDEILNFSNKPAETSVIEKPTTAQMYKINVDSTTTQDHSVEPAQEHGVAKQPAENVPTKPAESKEPINIGTLGAPESWPVESKLKIGKQADSGKERVPPVSYSHAAEHKQKPAIEKPAESSNSNGNKVKTFMKNAGKTEDIGNTDKNDEFVQLAKDHDHADTKSSMLRSPTPNARNNYIQNNIGKNYLTTNRATIDQRPPEIKYHWSLNSVRGGKIFGSPGQSMSVIGGIKVHNGVATLNDGIDRGYLDAGDFQGECVSDPDVCKKGLTLSLTSKIYRDSLESPTRLYLFDSGAGSEDSKGMALWVNKGKIEGAVSTRKGTWCLEEEIGDLKDRWVDYVMTWHPMRGLYLYANCRLLAVSGFGRGCDVCTRSDCHQLDRNTHLMFGRPNKGPHFKLTHFSAGDITVYEDFFDLDGVSRLCVTNNDNLKRPKIAPARMVSNSPLKSPLDVSAYVMKKQHLTGALPEFNVPSLNKDPKVIGNEFEVWPTPSGLHFLSALFNTNPPEAKPAQREIVKVDGGYSEWTSWTSCIGACGGTSMASRYCNNPVPKRGGNDCSQIGPARRTRQCDETNCLALDNVRAIARFEKADSDIENDISKRKEISRTKEAKINQEKDINSLKEEFSMLKHR